MKVFVIFLLIITFMIPNPVTGQSQDELNVKNDNAVLYSIAPSKDDAFLTSDLAVTGKIESHTNSQYTISVDKYLKNPLPFGKITAFGSENQFKEGELGIFYLDAKDGSFVLNPASHTISKPCGDIQSLHLIPYKLPDSDILSSDYKNYRNALLYPYMFQDLAYPLVNTSTKSVIANVTLVINDEISGTNNPIINKTETIALPACNGYSMLYWFFEIDVGKYRLILTDKGGMDSTSSFNFRVAPDKEYSQMGSDIIKKDDQLSSFDDSIYKYTDNYEKLRNCCTDYLSELLPPLKQANLGTPAWLVECKEGYSGLVKTLDESPACVKRNSVDRMVQNGWDDNVEYGRVYWWCNYPELSKNGEDLLVTCRDDNNINSKEGFVLPDPVSKRQQCTGTYGCSGVYSYVPQIPDNLLTQEQKQIVLDKILQLPNAKNFPAEPQLDRIRVSPDKSSWEADVQFFFEGVKDPAHDTCEYYDSATINLETFEVINGFRESVKVELCGN